MDYARKDLWNNLFPFITKNQKQKRRTPSLPLKLLARTPNLQPLKHGGIPPAVHSAMMPSPINPCLVRRPEDLPAQKRCVGAVLCLSHPALLDGQNSLQSHSSWSPAVPQSHGSSVVLLVFLLPTQPSAEKKTRHDLHQLKLFFHAISWKASNDLLVITTCTIFLSMQPSRTRQKSLETRSLFSVQPSTGQRGHYWAISSPCKRSMLCWQHFKCLLTWRVKD